MAGFLEASAYSFNYIDEAATLRTNPNVVFTGFLMGFFIYDPSLGFYTIGDYSKCIPFDVAQLYLKNCNTPFSPADPGVHSAGTWRFTGGSANAQNFPYWLSGIECVWLKSEGSAALLQAADDIEEHYRGRYC